MEEIANEFNEGVLSLLDLIKTVTGKNELEFYYKVVRNFMVVEKHKLIEQYIIHCLPHKKRLEEKNIDFFKNIKYEEKHNNLFQIVKIKDMANTVSSEEINLVFEYLILLSNYAIQYFQIY